MKDKKYYIEKELVRKQELLDKAIAFIPSNQEEADYRHDFICAMQDEIDCLKKGLDE
jgi:hypothetical protein